MAAGSEAYMLQRNTQESRRLDNQHDLLRNLMDGKLVHPFVPLEKVRAVADVGTGTGLWLKDLRQTLQETNQQVELVGFDISELQFPQELRPDIELVLHDIVETFPQKYHGKFDLVQVRLLSYAIKAKDLVKAVESVCQIIRKYYWDQIQKRRLSIYELKVLEDICNG